MAIEQYNYGSMHEIYKIIATEEYSVDLCIEDQIVATKHTRWIYVLVQKMSPKGTKAGWYSRNLGCRKNDDATGA